MEIIQNHHCEWLNHHFELLNHHVRWFSSIGSIPTFSLVFPRYRPADRPVPTMRNGEPGTNIFATKSTNSN